MVKLAKYVVASVVGASAVIYHAFRSRQQFYPAMLYLATSKICLVVLLNMALVMLCAVWQLIKSVFLGSLREAEVERLNEQSWREVMEILFAMTIFREEFNVSFVAMITVLLFIKAFHWLAQKRVEFIETTPSVPRLSHLRIVSFLMLLLFLDTLFLHVSFAHLLKTRKPSVSLFFAFEYMILATSTITTFLKYALFVVDMVMEGQWDSKAVYIFYLELVRDLIHLSLYLFFFLVIFIHYGIPLHLVRELYETFRNFKARVADFIRYRKITSNMNDRFPDATAEELGRGDATCIICREEMSVAKKLPCGHLFHVHCLRSWLERQQTCPTCRSPVLVPETGAYSSGAGATRQQDRQNENQGGAVPEGHAQFYGQVAGNGVLSPQHQARLRAAAAAAAQYGSSFVYPGGNWCVAYVPMVPQPYMASPVHARQNGLEGGSVPADSAPGDRLAQGSEQGAAGESSSAAAPAQAGLHPSGPAGYWLYPQVPSHGLYQFPNFPAAPGLSGATDGGASASASRLDWQLEQREAMLRRELEVTQEQRQHLICLKNENLTAAAQQHEEAAAAPGQVSSSGHVDSKGKAPLDPVAEDGAGKASTSQGVGTQEAAYAVAQSSHGTP